MQITTDPTTRIENIQEADRELFNRALTELARTPYPLQSLSTRGRELLAPLRDKLVGLDDSHEATVTELSGVELELLTHALGQLSRADGSAAELFDRFDAVLDTATKACTASRQEPPPRFLGGGSS